MNIGHVQNGTNAGWKKQKPAHVAWVCPSCTNENARHRNQCVCGTRR